MLQMIGANSGATGSSLSGGADLDTFDLGGFTYTGSIAGGSESDTLTGANNYTVTGAGSGTSTKVSAGWSQIENLSGTSGADTFSFTTGSITGGSSSSIARIARVMTFEGSTHPSSSREPRENSEPSQFSRLRSQSIRTRP